MKKTESSFKSVQVSMIGRFEEGVDSGILLCLPGYDSMNRHGRQRRGKREGETGEEGCSSR